MTIKYTSHLQSGTDTHQIQLPEAPTPMAEAGAVEIRNCEFAFRCTRQWSEMYRSADESKRYCKDCNRYVHLCADDAALATAIRENLCVAIPVKWEEGPAFLLGALKSRSYGSDEQ